MTTRTKERGNHKTMKLHCFLQVRQNAIETFHRVVTFSKNPNINMPNKTH